MLNLASAANAESKDVLWGFLARYGGGLSPDTHPKVDLMAGHAVRYFIDFVKPEKAFKPADDVEREALAGMDEALAGLDAGADGETIQNAMLAVARRFERFTDPAKTGPDGSPAVTSAFFQMIYQVLLGEDRGPRFGSFVELYGIAETRALIAKALAGQLLPLRDTEAA